MLSFDIVVCGEEIKSITNRTCTLLDYDIAAHRRTAVVTFGPISACPHPSPESRDE